MSSSNFVPIPLSFELAYTAHPYRQTGKRDYLFNWRLHLQSSRINNHREIEREMNERSKICNLVARVDQNAPQCGVQLVDLRRIPVINRTRLRPKRVFFIFKVNK